MTSVMTPHASENAEEKVTTVIADDLYIKGAITFTTSLMIKGTLEGEIVSEGLLVVGPTARINAEIATKSLVSHGEIQGDVTATEQVVLKSTSVHTGNITTPYIVVESGSVFNGSCVMERDATAMAPLVKITPEVVEGEGIAPPVESDEVPPVENPLPETPEQETQEAEPEVEAKTSEAPAEDKPIEPETTDSADRASEEQEPTEPIVYASAPGQLPDVEPEEKEKPKKGEENSEFSLMSKWFKRELF